MERHEAAHNTGGDAAGSPGGCASAGPSIASGGTMRCAHMPDPSPPGPRRILRSWKEIAAHLKVDARTAQRWQTQAGLPVYRRAIGVRSQVTAYTDELDRWLTGRSGQTGEPAAVPASPGIDAPSGRIRPPRAWVWLAGALVLAAAATGAWWWRAAADPFRVEAANRLLQAYDESGRRLWSAHLPGSGEMALPDGVIGGDRSVIEDLTGDGRSDVVVRVVASASEPDTGRVLAYRHDGRLLWDRPLDRVRPLNGRTDPARYSPLLMRLVRAQGQMWLLVVGGHRWGTACPVLLLDPASGTVVDEYWHPGILIGAVTADLDDDGEAELVLGGLSNPSGGLGHGALVVLKLPFSSGPARTGGLATFSGGREVAYVLFPRPGVCTARGEYPFVRGLEVIGGQLQARVECGFASAFYTVDPGLRLDEVRLSDRFAPIHADLVAQGLLDYPLEPDGLDCLRRIVRSDTTIAADSAEARDVLAGCR